ncbi:ABC transporter ATP-binding protein [Desertimonas flava]|uniref:ABC transporter ATP-binding protein n=1 Tax=Desertimonas flava TaxID=2064846 RepID=UPI0013C43920|nr:ABC transporter ATP-binding protein [Desertimonas flava]
MRDPSGAALFIDGVGKRFQGVEALADVTIAVADGAVHGIVGPNGAGKTTLLNVVTGYVRADAGRVLVHSVDVTGWSPNRRVPLGLVRTFQNIRLFGGLTVHQNVLIGQHSRATSGFASMWPFPTAKERALRAEADDCIERLGLGDYRDRLAGEMPYGLQKQLELARALMAHPRVLLLDEPAAGMTEADREEFVPRILALRDTGVTIVIVEHDMNVITKSCDVVTVLNFGRLLAEGPPAETLASDDVRTAYVGV